MTKHQEMVRKIKGFVKQKEGYSLHTPTSLPFGCTMDTRLLLPDILVTKEGDITHIIEPETSTGGATICGKIALAEESIRIMVEAGKQSSGVKPKIVFLYAEGFLKTHPNHLERVNNRVSAGIPNLKYLQPQIIKKFPDGWKWF